MVVSPSSPKADDDYEDEFGDEEEKQEEKQEDEDDEFEKDDEDEPFEDDEGEEGYGDSFEKTRPSEEQPEDGDHPDEGNTFGNTYGGGSFEDDGDGEDDYGSDEEQDDGAKDDGEKDDGEKDDGKQDDVQQDDGKQDDWEQDDGERDDGEKDDWERADAEEDGGGNQDDVNTFGNTYGDTFGTTYGGGSFEDEGDEYQEGDDHEEGKEPQADDGGDEYREDGDEEHTEEPSRQQKEQQPKGDGYEEDQGQEHEEQQDAAYDDGGGRAEQEQLPATTERTQEYTMLSEGEDDEEAEDLMKDVDAEDIGPQVPARGEEADEPYVEYEEEAKASPAATTQRRDEEKDVATTQRLDAQEDVVEETLQDEWGDQDVADAILLFKTGDFNRAAALARNAAGNCKQRAESILEKDEDLDQRPRSRPTSAASDVDQGDAWRTAMDKLAAAHEDAGDAERAEALYLRMLAWREGAEQYEAGNFLVSETLFEKSPAYRSVEDATWFLQNLRPDDGHAAMEAVGLLALGEEVAAKAAVAVWTLALRPAQREKLTECGALELVAKAVAFHAENPELQAAGCGALRLLCSGNRMAGRNRRHLIQRLNGAESIANALRMHKQDPEVQREACGALRAAAAKNPAGARRIIENDGFKLCLQAIVECPDEAVGGIACKALAALQCASQVGFKSSDAQSENLEAVWEAKLRAEREAGMQFCDENLRVFLACSDRVVVQALLGAVSIFVEDSNVRHRALVLVEPVVACMQAFPGVDKIQVPACGILWGVTVGNGLAVGAVPGLTREEGVMKVASCGGMGAICQAMRDLPCHPYLQRLCVGALRNMAYGNDRNKTLAVRAGAIPCAVLAMQRFPKDAKLQEQGIGALTSLCDTLGRATVMARQGGIPSVVAAVKRHGASGEPGHLAELGCIFLCMLCDDQQLRQEIQKSGAMSVAKALSKASNPEAQKWGCELMRGLAEL